MAIIEEGAFAYDGINQNLYGGPVDNDYSGSSGAIVLGKCVTGQIIANGIRIGNGGGGSDQGGVGIGHGAGAGVACVSVGSESDAFSPWCIAIGSSSRVNGDDHNIGIGAGMDMEFGSYQICIGQILTPFQNKSTTIGTPGQTTAALIYGLNVVTINTIDAVSFNSHGVNESIVNTSASGVANLTITLPTASVAGQIIRYTTAGDVATVNVTGGNLALGTLTAMVSNQTVEFMASNLSGTWYRIR